MMSSKQKVLVVGGTGMLGHKLVNVLAADKNLAVHCSVRRLPPAEWRASDALYHEGIEIGYDRPALPQLLARLAPDVVVNAAGAVKQKDLGPVMDATLYLNGVLPHMIALRNPNRQGRLVHISTDCVFRGDRGGYLETDAPDAVDLYGRSKAIGEVDYGNHLTIRTSMVGWEMKGFLGLLSWFVRQPEDAEVPGFERAIFSGLPTVTLAHTIAALIRNGIPMSGVYHVASEPINKRELLERVAHALALTRRVVPSDAVVIDRSLNDTAFRTATSTKRPGWDELTDALAEDFRSLPYSDVYGISKLSKASL
jgi:dTDP-4-dehydrorhamnose reductase